MPYEYVEFNVNPPIKETIGNVPEDIKLIHENDAVTGLQVIIGEEKTEEIKKTAHFKEMSDGKSGNDFINLLEKEIRGYATQKAKKIINQVNFEHDSSIYKVQLTTLAILTFQRCLSAGTGAYVTDFNSKTDLFDIRDEDNFFCRILEYYINGLNSKENKDLVSAYKYFYLVIPESQEITSDPKLNEDLKILRHGVSHSVLHAQSIMDRSRELLGDEYVKTDSNGKHYAYIDISTQEHVNLFKKYVPIIKKSAREYIDGYKQEHISSPLGS